MPSRIKAHLALLAVALFYAGNYLIAKVVMNGQYLGPLGFVLLRVASATILFWILALFIRGQKVERKDWPRFVLCGLTGVAANQSLFFSGLELTTPVHASLIMTTTPILVLFLSYLILKTSISLRKILGIMLGCVGAVILMVMGKEVEGSPEFLLGDALILANATSYGLYLVLVKKLIAKYSPLTVIRWVFTVGLCVMIPIGYAQLSSVNWASFDLNIWLAVLYVIICVTFLAYLLNIYALKRVEPSTVAIYIYIQPFLASVLSVFMGMESMDFVKVMAGILIFFGVFLVSDFRPALKK